MVHEEFCVVCGAVILCTDFSFALNLIFQISIKYDPFMNLSVPLPKDQKILPVIIFFKDHKRVPLKVLKSNDLSYIETYMCTIQVFSDFQFQVIFLETTARKFCKEKSNTSIDCIPFRFFLQQTWK